MYWKVNGVKQWNEQRDLRPDLRVYVHRESSDMCMHDRYKNTLPSVTQLVSMPHSDTEGTSRLEWCEHDCFSTDLDHRMVYAAFLVLLMLVWGYCVFWGIDVRTHTYTHTCMHTHMHAHTNASSNKRIQVCVHMQLRPYKIINSCTNEQHVQELHSTMNTDLHTSLLMNKTWSCTKQQVSIVHQHRDM